MQIIKAPVVVTRALIANEKANDHIYSNMLRQLFIAVSIFAQDRRLIDVSSPLAIRRYIIPFRLGTLITFLTRKPIVPAKMHSRRSALPTIDIGGRINAAARQQATGNNNQHDIYPRNTQRAQRAAVLLPSFRSPRLCNYDFIFMDINYTGRLAVSLYGILIQGCRHNGNPRHTDSLLTCP